MNVRKMSYGLGILLGCSLWSGSVLADLSVKIDTDKAIYRPWDQVNIDVLINSDQAKEDVTIAVDVIRELDNVDSVHTSVVSLPEGETSLDLKWVAPDNVWGHHGRVTVTASDGSLLGSSYVQFDVVDKWWKVMRLAASSGITLANAGPPDSPGRYLTDNNIMWKAKVMRRYGWNTTEMFHYADPYNMTMDGLEVWPYMDRLKDHLISRDRLIQWGKELKRQGMGYLAYNEMASITGSDEWKLRNKYSYNHIWCSYYCDEEVEGVEYFVPNGNFIGQVWADTITGAIEDFGFTGVFQDSGFGIGRIAVEQSRDFTNNKRIPGPIGTFMANFQAPATEQALALNPSFGFVHSNMWPMTSRARLRPTPNPPLDEVYGRLKDYADTQNVYEIMDEVQITSIEWDSANSPRDAYPQTYQEMTTYMAGTIDILDRTMLQWAFLSGRNSTVAYVRPKMAMYLAAGMMINDHHNMYEGVLRGAAWREKPANQQIMLYMQFWARYMYYITNPDWDLVRPPQFEVASSGNLYWKDGVRSQIIDGRNQYVINFLNLPADNKIQGQREIPAPIADVVVDIPASLGHFEAWLLNADNPDLTPVKLELEITEAGQRFVLPPVVAWQVVVLKEIDPPRVEIHLIKLREIQADLNTYLEDF